MSISRSRRLHRFGIIFVGAILTTILVLGLHGAASYYALNKIKILLNDNLSYAEELLGTSLERSDFGQMGQSMANFAAAVGVLGAVMIPLGVLLGFTFISMIPTTHQLIARSNMRIRTNRITQVFFAHKYIFLITTVGLLFSTFLFFVDSANDIQHEREKEIRDSINMLSISDTKTIVTQLDNFLSGRNTISYHSSAYSQAYFIGVIILLATGILGYNHRMRILADSIANQNATNIMLTYICVICFVSALVAIGYWIGASAFGVI